MECFICNNSVSNEARCPYCGTDLRSYRRIMLASQSLYNDGLAKAGLRDLSGAIDSLKRSLKYNKYNREARNLLGLVYFESGQTVRALNEWVISKNFYPKSNPVDHYLESLQNGSNTLDKLNQTAKKYNQSLVYVRQGSEDLAILQLKRVIQMNPNMLDARLLLALVYLKDAKYDDAKKEVSAVLKIDTGNTRALSYMQYIRQIQKEQGESSKRRRKKKNKTESSENNDINVSQRSGFPIVEGTGGAFLNILIGAILGLLICMFLIVPNIRQDAAREAAEVMLEANEKASASAADISALERQVETLQAQLDNYEGKADQKTSYENLINAGNKVVQEDFETAKSLLESVSIELLDSAGQDYYNSLSETVNAYTLERDYAEALSYMQDKDYVKAIALLQSVIELDEKYLEGEALMTLAECHAENEDNVSAANCYNKIIELYPDTSLARQASRAIEALSDEEVAESQARAEANSRNEAPAAAAEEPANEVLPPETEQVTDADGNPVVNE